MPLIHFMESSIWGKPEGCSPKHPLLGWQKRYYRLNICSFITGLTRKKSTQAILFQFLLTSSLTRASDHISLSSKLFKTGIFLNTERLKFSLFIFLFYHIWINTNWGLHDMTRAQAIRSHYQHLVKECFHSSVFLDFSISIVLTADGYSRAFDLIRNKTFKQLLSYSALL